MHYLTYVMIPNTDNIEGKVARALYPFDESLVVNEYVDYLESWRIEQMAQHFGIDRRNLAALAERMNEWAGCSGGVDEHGLYRIAHENPQRKWDWYEIGGRWDGHFRGNVAIADELAKRLPKQSPCALVTRGGEWLQSEFASFDDQGKYRVDSKAERSWRAEIRRALRLTPDSLVVAVDCHC